MAEFDSLSFALLIPFAICFALIFIVCCFADEIKDICRMPSPLPRSYLAPEHPHGRRYSNRRSLHHSRPQIEEVRNLILSEEGRSRNVSESSTDYIAANNVLANSVSNLNSSRQTGMNLHQNVMSLPQTTVLNVGQRSGIPNTNCVVLQPVINTCVTESSAFQSKLQPLNQFAAQNAVRNANFSRNLKIHASASSKDLQFRVKPQDEKDHPVNKNATRSLNRNESAPHLLNSYLTKGSSSAKRSSDSLENVVNENQKADQNDQKR